MKVTKLCTRSITLAVVLLKCLIDNPSVVYHIELAKIQLIIQFKLTKPTLNQYSI